MAWSYDVGALATSELYQIRLELQDTDATEMLLQDEEIAWIIRTKDVNRNVGFAKEAESPNEKEDDVAEIVPSE